MILVRSLEAGSSTTNPFYPIFSEQGMTVCRGVRGATTVEADDRDQILQATRQMLALMIRRNEIEATDVASVMYHQNE